MFNSILILVFIIGFITFLVDRSIRKKYDIVVEYGMHRPINNTHKWVTIISIILIVLCLIGAYVFSNVELYLIVVFILILVNNGFSAYMEYKHEREEKEYMISIVWLVGALVIFAGSMFLLFKTTTMEEIISDYESFRVESVEKVEVENYSWNDEKDIMDRIDYKRTMEVDDQQVIQQLFSELAKVEVRNGIVNQGDPENIYRLNMRDPDSEIYSIAIYNSYISIDSENYKVVGENDIYELLENGDFEWEYEGE